MRPSRSGPRCKGIRQEENQIGFPPVFVFPHSSVPILCQAEPLFAVEETSFSGREKQTDIPLFSDSSPKQSKSHAVGI